MDGIKSFVRFPFSSKLAFVLFSEILSSVILTFSLLYLFLKLSQEVLEKNIIYLDTFLTNFVSSFRSPLATDVMMFLTIMGGVLFLFVFSLIVIIYLFTKRKKDALIFLSILYSGILINLILKLNFQRPRPLDSMIYEATFSFPSGHAMNSFVFYVALSYFILRETKSIKITILASIISFVLILGIGVSRIYLGVHYPSDVIAGYIAGFLWFISAILFEKSIIFERLYKLNRK